VAFWKVQEFHQETRVTAKRRSRVWLEVMKLNANGKVTDPKKSTPVNETREVRR